MDKQTNTRTGTDDDITSLTDVSEKYNIKVLLRSLSKVSLCNKIITTECVFQYCVAQK